jgi:hypothetical protein
MDVDENDFRRQYADLSDEGLKSISREDLVEIARECYDQELASRGLRPDQQVVEETSERAEKFVSAATFLFPDEAEIARGLLRSYDVPCYLENEHVLAKVWQWNVALGGLRLMVPAALVEHVNEMLSEVSTENRQDVQDGIEEQFQSSNGNSIQLFARGRRGRGARVMLAIAVLCAPVVETLRLFYIG